MEIETHPFEPWLPSNAFYLRLSRRHPSGGAWNVIAPNYTNDGASSAICSPGDKQYFRPGKRTEPISWICSSRPERRDCRLRHCCASAVPQALPTRIWKSIKPADLDGNAPFASACQATYHWQRGGDESLHEDHCRSTHQDEDGRPQGVPLRPAVMYIHHNEQQQPCLSHEGGEEGRILRRMFEEIDLLG